MTTIWTPLSGMITQQCSVVQLLYSTWKSSSTLHSGLGIIVNDENNKGVAF